MFPAVEQQVSGSGPTFHVRSANIDSWQPAIGIVAVLIFEALGTRR
jgi:hypothetical protein